MENAALTDKYKEKREAFEKSLSKYPLLEDKKKDHTSPGGKYLLIITPYETGEGYWNYTKGTIYDNTTGEELFTIFRNYPEFWFQWADHKNGNYYLLCGEDYQGYVCLNLTERKKYVYFPESGFKGWGFCWVGVKEYDKEYDDNIIVEGCYWGAQFENVRYDFTNPDELPYRQIERWDVAYEDEDDEEKEEDDDE